MKNNTSNQGTCSQTLLHSSVGLIMYMASELHSKFNLITFWHGDAIPTFPIKYLFDQTHYMLYICFVSQET